MHEVCEKNELILFSFCCTAVSPVVRGLIGSRHSSVAAKDFRAILQQHINDIQAAGTYKNERVITSPQKTVITIEGTSRSVINFCANNYLGLSVSITVNSSSCEFRTQNDSFNFLSAIQMWLNTAKTFWIDTDRA